MTEPATWAAVGMAAVSNMATWLVILKGRKNGRNNNRGPKPGQADVCIKRGEKMASMETEQKHLNEDIHEIKRDIRCIKEAVIR